MTTAEKIRKCRIDLGLTQEQLGNLLGVKKNAVSKWERGRVDAIPVSKLKKMAELFGVPNHYLMDDDDDELVSHGAILPYQKIVRNGHLRLVNRADYIFTVFLGEGPQSIAFNLYQTNPLDMWSMLKKIALLPEPQIKILSALVDVVATIGALDESGVKTRIVKLDTLEDSVV